MSSLRSCVNQMCRGCIYDPCAPGTWRTQVTLCAVKSCPLYDIRPKTTSDIPASVLRWYGVKQVDLQQLSLPMSTQGGQSGSES